MAAAFCSRATELEVYINNVLTACEKTGQRCRQVHKRSSVFLTLDTVRGMLKSFPPCSLKPQGDEPLRVTEYTFIALTEREIKAVLLSLETSRSWRWMFFDFTEPS